MISMLMDFASLLKREGIMIAPSSLHSAIQAMEYIDPLDQEEFHGALAGCLIHNGVEMETFEKCYRDFFILKKAHDLDKENLLFKAKLREFTDQLREGAPVNHILADYIEGDSRKLLNFMNIEGVEPDGGFTPVDEEMKSKTQGKRRDQEKLRNRVNVLIELAEDFSARSFNLTREKRQKLSDFLRERLMEAAELMDKKSKVRNRRQIMPWEKKRTLSSISFSQLTDQEIERVKEEVDKLALKLKDALSQQKKRAKKGHIDIKRTIRDSIKYGGVPFHIKNKEPAKKKGKVVALCDISSSVSYAAQFMILLLYRLQNRFSKIRSFVFIRQTYDIGRYFETYPLEKAMVQATKDHHIGMGQPSNYGNSFLSFAERFPNVLTKDTTLLILGDGQNNFNDPQVQHFEALTKQVERTIWLNPEEEKFWYSASNSVRHYQPYCDQMIECATLDQLSDFVRKLVL